MSIARSQPARGARCFSLCALCSVAIAGCYGVQSPTDHAGYTRSESVVLSGYSLTPNRALVGIISPTPTRIGARFSGEIVWSGVSAATPAGSFESGRSYYGWTMSSLLPARAFRAEMDAGCLVDVAYLMVGEAAPSLSTVVELATPYLGATPALSETQSSCMEGALGGGSALNAARVTCGVTITPQRIVVSNRLVGDVTIDSFDDLAALRCIDEIDGSLTLASDFVSSAELGSGFPVALPRLKRVTGDLNLTYNMRPRRDVLDVPLRCGSRSALLSRSIDLPALAQVGGSLRIEVPGTSSSGGEYVDLGLNALSKVGADVDMRFEVPPEPCGLNALASVPGRLRFRWRMDVTPSPGRFLSALRTVGSLEIEQGDTISRWSGLLANLETAGSVRLYSIGSWQDPLPGLRRVTRDFAIIESALRDAITPRLTSIGGTLSVTGNGTSPLALGAATLTIGAANIADNTFRCMLESSSSCPALSAVRLRIRATGSLRVAGNAALAASEICGLRNLMISRGLTGAVDLGGTSCP